ncbi:hypothetical protein N0V88_002196 [Collariella sp. IMI 366227]|nr:hypothetical protein N0V88_002196 [Collariella sp. IMI 366227]
MRGLANSRWAPIKHDAPQTERVTPSLPLPLRPAPAPAVQITTTSPQASIAASPSPPSPATVYPFANGTTTIPAAIPVAAPATDEHATQHDHNNNNNHHSHHRSHPPHHKPHQEQGPNHNPLVPSQPTPEDDANPAAREELARCAKLLSRLQLKRCLLSYAYNLATGGVDAASATPAEKKIMNTPKSVILFKLEFFEFYMLVERFVVHLLLVYGVEVKRGGGKSLEGVHGEQQEGGEEGPSGKGLAVSRWNKAARHRYHANVLAMLDDEKCDLHYTLGVKKVREQLGRAKDLRNRWKTAEDEDEEEEQDHRDGSPKKDADDARDRRLRKDATPLKNYRLEDMLDTIFDGFGAAYTGAELHVKGRLNHWDEDVEMREEDDWADEDQWGFMVDAMDWEAV